MQARFLPSALLTILALATAMALPAPVDAQVYAQGNCTGMSATVDIDAYSHTCPDTLAADGDWSVSTGADRVLLEYYIDGTESGDKVQSETRAGLGGSWDFADDYSSSCEHTLFVKAYPEVWNGSGYATCWDHDATDSTGFAVSCTTPTVTIDDCEWTSCSGGLQGSCDGSCEGSVSGGGGSPFTYTWKWTENGSPQSQSGSAHTVELTCDGMTSVILEGEDSACGTDTTTWPCGAD